MIDVISLLRSCSERSDVKRIESNRNLSVNAWFRQLTLKYSLIRKDYAEGTASASLLREYAWELLKYALVLCLPSSH
jgi:hypothetical protein